MSARPRRLVVVAGTATEIGKTWTSVELARSLVGDGWTVSARKPAQSGDPGAVTDADLLAGATGEDPSEVCRPHRSYTVPMAPPMAADALGLVAPTVVDLAGGLAWGARAVDVGLIELAGGVASPAAVDGDGAELTAALAPDGVVLVADAGLGTINSVRLSAGRLRDVTGLEPLVVLNRHDDGDDLHRRNHEWLVERDGFRVVIALADLAAWVLALAPDYCPSCGRATDDCAGDCARPLDPDRYCVRCGRRLVVTVTPTRHEARCKVHGDRCT